jgi:hypothetical protein
MAMREMALCFCVFGLTATATAQTGAIAEKWVATSRSAQTGTGHVIFTPGKITFQTGKSLSLAPAGQMLFRPEAKKKKVMADLYRVPSSDEPALENGNKLCKAKPVAYLIIWKSEKTGKETDPRTLAFFSGPNFTAGSPDDCGHYAYDAGAH